MRELESRDMVVSFGCFQGGGELTAVFSAAAGASDWRFSHPAQSQCFAAPIQETTGECNV